MRRRTPPPRERRSRHGDPMLDTLLFGALPYVAIVLFLVVSIQRYRRNPFSFSSLSSQFLETRRLFSGMTKTSILELEGFGVPDGI